MRSRNMLSEARHWLTHLGVLVSRPAAFVIFLIYVAGWLTFGDEIGFHGFATIATWAMTLLIQRAEHRDTQAIHAKLDELLIVNHAAKNELMGVDDEDAEEVEKVRGRIRKTRGLAERPAAGGNAFVPEARPLARNSNEE